MNPQIKDHLNGNVGMEFLICSHCNLRCRACLRFSCISKPKFYDHDKLINDIKELKSRLDINRVTLSGGEPLLYPNIAELLYEIRSFFDGVINIFTNGKAFAKLGEKFFKALKDNNVYIIYTRYPGIDYDEIHKICNEYNVGVNNVYDFTDLAVPLVKEFCSSPLSVIETKTKEYKYINICNDTCPCVWDSKVWLCGRCALSENLNEKYNTKFKPTPLDYLEITKIKNRTQYFNFIKKPIFFCKYCFNTHSKMIPFETKNYCKEDYIK